MIGEFKKHHSKIVSFPSSIGIICLLYIVIQMSLQDCHAQRLRRFQPPGNYGKPNVILLAADNFNYQDFEFVRKNQTDFPNLNKLITNGVIFTRFYNAGFNAEDVYESYLFGYNPNLLGQKQTRDNSLNYNNLPISKVLKECEYFTGILGKWLIDDEVNQPIKIGFDQWFGFLTHEESTNLYPAYIWRNDAKFFLAANRGNAKGESAQRWFITTTTNFLRIYREYPFFLYLPSILPGGIGLVSNAQVIDDKGLNTKITEAMRKSLKEFDSYVGIILDYLRQFKISDKTLVILTGVADCKEEMRPSDKKNEIEFEQLVSAIETKLRVPLIVFWEGAIKAAITNDSLIASYDIYNTIIQLADGKCVTNGYSFSFVDNIFNRTNAVSPEFMCWETSYSQCKWIIRFDGYFAACSEKGKEWNFKRVNSENGKQVVEGGIEARANEFLKRATNGLPRIRIYNSK